MKRNRRSLRWERLTLFALLSLGCIDDPTRPDRLASVQVMVISTGGDPDLDGYLAVLDGRIRLTVDDKRATSIIATRGEHTLQLQDIATNCSVIGPNPRTVTVEAGSTDAVFQIVCIPTGIAVTTRTMGIDTPESYQLTVTAMPPLPISPNGAQSVSRLVPGTYTVELLVPINCTVSGGNRITVDVVSLKVAARTFDVACVQAVRSKGILYTADVTESNFVVPYVEMVHLDGTGTVRLGRGDSPAWSPDGKRFVYSTAGCWPGYYYDVPTCTGGLSVMDPELGDLRSLNAGYGFRPAWSPRGDVIAYELRPLDRNGFVDARRGMNVITLAAPSPTALDIVGPLTKEHPAWSPDGRRIVFACTWEANPNDSDICVVNSDGTALVRLTNDASSDAHPAWSPDGGRIAFTRFSDVGLSEPSMDVVVLDLVSGQRTVLTPGVDPAWSPDGSRLVFGGFDGLYVIGADGTNRTRLTTGPHHSPAWRP